MKHPMSSKTVRFAILLAFLGGLLPFLEGASDVPSWVLVVIGALVAGLRAVTIEPIGRPGATPGAKNIAKTSLLAVLLLVVGCASSLEYPEWRPADGGCQIVKGPDGYERRCAGAGLEFDCREMKDGSWEVGRVLIYSDGSRQRYPETFKSPTRPEVCK